MFVDRYGPWAVIVGGSEGVGASLAEQLAEKGLNLVLVARKPGPLEEAAERVRAAYKCEVRTVSLDITAPDMVERLAEATSDIEVGLLIYNAGSASPHSFLDASIENELKIMALNPIGQLKLAHHFGRRMRDLGHGGMIFIGSLSGTAGGGGHATYCASKAFTQKLSEALWAELRHHNIDVLGFIIGATRTPFMDREGLNMDHPDYLAADPADVARQALENITNGPVQVPSELAESFKALSSMGRRDAAEAMSAGIAAVGIAADA